MNSKKGIVIETSKTKATLITKTGEFVDVKIKDSIPAIGEEYTGNKYMPINFFKYPLIAACLIFMVFLGTNIYAYYTPVASITISINPSLKVEVNKWNKIIKTTALNKDGEVLLKNLDIKNKLLQTGLNEIVEESKKDNFINKAYIDSGKIITVSVDSDANTNIDVAIDNFKASLEKNNLKIVINNNNNQATPTTKPKNDTKKNPRKNNENNSNTTNNVDDTNVIKKNIDNTKININSNNSSTKNTNENNHKTSNENNHKTTNQNNHKTTNQNNHKTTNQNNHKTNNENNHKTNINTNSNATGNKATNNNAATDKTDNKQPHEKKEKDFNKK